MSVSMKMGWTELAESLAEGQRAMEKAGFDMGRGHVVEGHAMPVPPRPFLKQDGRNVEDWLRMQNLHNEVRVQDDLIRQLMARQDRQGKWIAFLLISWLFTCAFVWFGVLVAV